MLNQPVLTGENFCNASPLDIEAVYRIRATASVAPLFVCPITPVQEGF